MSTSFQSCPKCKSFILSDTFECPECGHVFDETRAEASRIARDAERMKSLEMYDTCRECGESVRTGLVRCWNCNAFMRQDVEASYRKMTSNPQPIIFSDIPKHERTEFIPARDGADKMPDRAQIFDADEDDTEFTLQSTQKTPQAATKAPPQPPATTPAADSGEDDFELDSPKAASGASSTAAPSGSSAAPPADAGSAGKDTEAVGKRKADSGRATGATTSGEGAEADDLLDIALQDQRETRRRKREKLEEARRQRILMPCSCGAWIRVHQDQAGRVVRCRQCKKPVVVPVMKKKDKETAAATKQSAEIKITWLEDVHRHVITPTDVVLKPGSLEKTFEPVDVLFHESGVHLVKYAAPAKKSLFGKSADGPPAVEEQRRLAGEHIRKTGKIADIPFGELQSIEADQVRGIRLIQPVAEAHASMFAGVPVFGEGLIAVYLPLELGDNQQAFLSFPLHVCRQISEQLQTLFSVDIGAAENGVPATEEYETLLCHLSEVPVKSLKNVQYYQADPAFTVELAGYICGTCGIAISEEARAKKKLGGAAGKGIAKAKCPKCSNKFGDQKAWQLTKTPDDDAKKQEEEDVSEVLKAQPAKAPAAAAEKNSPGVTAESLQGEWKMVSLGPNGNFARPNDMSQAGILFTIDGEKYTVKAGDSIQEQGTVAIDLAQDPPHLDQKLSEGPDSGKSHLGIFRIVDGRLENCQAAFGQPRPTSFDPEGNSTASLAVFERAR
ncbi:MAG: TIGR03067 domain-containing protein [Fuerstiella sp.]